MLRRCYTSPYTFEHERPNKSYWRTNQSGGAFAENWRLLTKATDQGIVGVTEMYHRLVEAQPCLPNFVWNGRPNSECVMQAILDNVGFDFDRCLRGQGILVQSGVPLGELNA